MRLIRAAALRPSPWKNGGGETREIAVFPPGAGLAGFDWRLSMATVAGDGPFSVFPGIDRTLFLLAGEGLSLSFSDGAERELRPGDRLDFSAEMPVCGRLIGGAVRDLNIMVRRDRFHADAHERTITGADVLALTGADTALHVRHGRIVVGGAAAVGPGDTVLFGPEDGDAVAVAGNALVILIGFRQVARGPDAG